MIREKIFGKVMRFVAEAQLKSLVVGATDLYDDCGNYEDDVLVRVASSLAPESVLASNPKIYQKVENGFVADYGGVRVRYSRQVGEALHIDLEYKRGGFGLRAVVSAIRSMEFGNELERFVQVLHELVLVPSTYFFTDLAPIHAASFAVNQKAIIFTGTGGVGKSSALLVAAECKDSVFISDDIAVLGSGAVYGNMAWPKIYGYNCAGTGLRRLILAGRGILNKTHFILKNWLNPASVRRKIRPDKLFNHVCSGKMAFHNAILVFRSNDSSVAFNKIDKDEFINCLVCVMRAEYQVFHKFIEWEEYNSQIIGRNPILRMSTVEDSWRRVLNAALGQNLSVAYVPFSINHNEYKDLVVTMIK